MYIHEAVKEALEKDAYISREDIEGEKPHRATRIKPTNSYGACLVIIIDEKGKEISRCRCWNPSAEDLTAKDWTVVANDKIICTSCKSENISKANFCRKCGKKLREYCKCWVLHRDNYNCGKSKCPGYALRVIRTKKEQEA